MARGPGSLSVRTQGLRYIAVGLWNTVFGYGAFTALHLTVGDRVHYLATLVAATALAILNAYAGYRRFVFRVEGHVLRDLGRFSAVYLAAFAVNAALLPVFVEMMGLPVLLAQALVVGGTVVASFFAHRTYSFRRPAPDPPAA